MKKVLLFHGTTNAAEYYSCTYPSLSNSHWFPWLQKELLIHKIEAHTPEVFEAYKIRYDKWLREAERYTIDSDTTLVGHSCGGGFLVRFLSENKNLKVDKVIMVAPWINTDNVRKTDMFHCEIDPLLSERAKKVIVFYSDNDMPTINKTIKKLRSTLQNVEFREFKGYGHFCYGDLKTGAFPELLEEILR